MGKQVSKKSYMILGIAIGVAFGIVMGNLVMGIVVGLGIGGTLCIKDKGFKKDMPVPTLLQDPKTASEWVIKALNSSGYQVSMHIESLKEVDRFFDEHMDDNTHKPKKGGLLSEDMEPRLFAIASLIGEVVINTYGGEWVVDDKNKHGGVNIAVKLPSGAMIWPAQRVAKRCGEGPENDIYHYAVLSGKE